MIEVKGIKIDPKWEWLAMDSDGFWGMYSQPVCPTKIVGRAPGWASSCSEVPTAYTNKIPIIPQDVQDWEDSLHEIIHTEDGFKLVKPRPDLRVDDPVMVRLADSGEWTRRHFSRWLNDGRIVVWVNGLTSFTSEEDTFFNHYRLPTPEELNRNK